MAKGLPAVIFEARDHPYWLTLTLTTLAADLDGDE